MTSISKESILHYQRSIDLKAVKDYMRKEINNFSLLDHIELNI